MDAAHGNPTRAVEGGADALEGALGAGAAGAVHGADLLGGGVVVEEEHVAADAGGAWFGDVEASG